jgi:outer membrane protein assembly factor BamB
MSRPRLSVCAAFLAVLCAGAATAAPRAGTDTAPVGCFKGGVARTGFIPSGPEPPLKLRWKFQSAENAGKIESYPSVDDGFSPALISQGVVYVGGHDGRIYAIDALNGRKIWEFRTGDHVMPGPILHDGRLFVGSMDGFYYALDAKTGAVVWKYESGYKVSMGTKYGGVRATPVITGGKVVFGG